MLRYIILLVIVSALQSLVAGQQSARNFFDIQKEMEAYYAVPAHRTNGYKQYKRAEYYLQTRLDPNGDIVNTEKRKLDALKKYKPPAVYSQQRSYSGHWEFFGPLIHSDYNGIGRVNRIAFHPTEEDIIYAATAGGGLWYTFNHGTFWIPLTESLPVNNLSGVVIDYTDPDHIYILTGDGDGCCGGARSYKLRKPSTGVLESNDGGLTWRQTGLVFNEQDETWGYDLVMHPTVPEVLFVCTDEGVYRTLNGGDDWIEILDEKIFELKFNTGDPGTIYAVSEANVYRSTTIGLAWNDTIPIPNYDDEDSRMSLATTPLDPDLLYLVAAPGNDSLPEYRGFYRSLDGGQSFDFIIDTPNIVQNQPHYDLTIVCDPNDQNQIMVGAVSLWRSSAGGTGFSSIGGTHADIHQLIVNPLNDRLYAATDGGIYYSEDFGDSWTFLSDFLSVTQYYKIAMSQQDPNVVIGGSQDNGTHRNVSVVTTVMDHIYGKDGMDCAIHPLNDSLMIYSAQDGEFVISRDQGTSEDSLIYVDKISGVRSAWVTPVAWDPNDSTRIFIGSDPVYRSLDAGATFNPIPDTVSGRRVLHIAPNDGQRIYAGDLYVAADDTRPFHLWTSANGGNSWIRIDTAASYPDSTLVMSAITTNPDNADEVWIAFGGWASGKKVYLSTDAGMTWENRSGSLPNVPVNTIVYQDTDGSPEEAVYIGTDLGVFYHDANLGDWIPFNNGMPLVEVADLEISVASGKLTAGTHGRGIWQSDIFSACVSDLVMTPVLQSDGHSYFFQTSDSITSDLQVDGFGVSVVYQAGNVVHLQEGFHASAKKGALFYATNKPCTGGVPAPLVTNSGTPLPESNIHPETVSPVSEKDVTAQRKHSNK